MIQLLLTFLLFIFTVSCQRIELFDYQPSEPFLRVYLNIYDMNIVHPTHSIRINEVLGNFENNPAQLYNDEICFGIVTEAIIMGFTMSNGSFFYERSRRLLTRILQSNPNRNVILQLMLLFSTAELPNAVMTVFDYYNVRDLSRLPIHEFIRANSFILRTQ